MRIQLPFCSARPGPCEAGRPSEADRDEFYSFLEKLIAKIREASEKPGSILIIPCNLVKLAVARCSRV